MNKTSLIFALAFVATALSACVSDTEVGSDIGDVSGSLRVAAGKTVPPTGEVYVVWGVSSGSPDYSYLFGGGTSTDTRFSIALPHDPPAEALNSYGIGIGVVLLMPPGSDLPEGRTDAIESTAEAQALGAAGRYAIVFKTADATDLHWSSDFPIGYSCGVEDPTRRSEPPDSGFEGFAPIDCGDVEIQVDDLANIEFTNWT